MTLTPKVFVVDAVGRPLLPTHPARARKLLNTDRACVAQVIPFTIKLKKEISNPVGNFTVGVDDGAKFVGIAIKNDRTEEIVFRATLRLRQDVKRKMTQRAFFRRSRRSRKLRYRSPRYSNRIKSKLPPSIRNRKDSVIRVINDMGKRLPLSGVIVEEVAFDHFNNRFGKNFSLVEIGKTYLKQQLLASGLSYKKTFGYITKPARQGYGMSKTHCNDATAITCPSTIRIACLDYHIWFRRSRSSNTQKKFLEKRGFRHYDVIKASHRTRGTVVGSVSSLKAKRITLRFKEDRNFPVSYNKSKILQRPDGLVYSY